MHPQFISTYGQAGLVRLILQIFCVFPSLLTVLLGPVVVTLTREFVHVV